MNKRVFGLVPLAIVATTLFTTGCKHDKRNKCSSQKPLIVNKSTKCSKKKNRCGQNEPVLGQVQSNINNADSKEVCELMCVRIDSNTRAIEELRTMNIRGDTQPASLPFSDDPGLMLWGDLLFWQARQDNVEFAVEVDIDVASNKRNGRPQEVNFDWDYGLRVGLGYQFDGDYWDTKINWTWFESASDRKKSSDAIATRFFSPAWGFSLLGSEAAQAKGSWDLDYNVIDWELGRHFFISESITARPHIGLRGACIEQKVRAEYTDLVYPAAGGGVLTTPERSVYKGKNDWHGAGIRVGADVLFHFTTHWGLFGKFSGSLLSGEFDVKASGTGFEESNAALVALSGTVKQELHRVRANLEAQLGVQWMYTFESGAYINILVGYDASKWFDQNQLWKANIGNALLAEHIFRESGHLGLHGGSARVELKF